MRRRLSGGAELVGDRPWNRAAVVALGVECFQLEALVSEDFPPDLELNLFRRNAGMKVLDGAALVEREQWEVDERGDLPAAFCSFMANGLVAPVAFKQRVLQAENSAHQQLEQMAAMFSEGSLLEMLTDGRATVPLASLFFALPVRREHLLQDSLLALAQASQQDLRRPLKVKFAGEEGVDEGGVCREYFRLLSAQLLAPEYGMFKADPDSRYLWFDVASFNDRQDFWIIGVIVGLAVYNNLPGFDVSLPPVLFKKLKDELLTLEDLERLSPAHTSSLRAVLDWEAPPELSRDDAGRLFLDTFCLDFSVSYEVFGEPVTVSLLPEEPPPAVTLERREEFGELFKAWHLTTSIRAHYDAFAEGFRHVCGGSSIVECLSWVELEAIVCGERDLDFEHLRRGTMVIETEVAFREGYIDSFWEVATAFDSSRKKQFLNFVTGSDLAPVGGLERLELHLQRSEGEPTTRLPTAHTCFNLLMLPEYNDVEKLNAMLLLAIENADGFGLE